VVTGIDQFTFERLGAGVSLEVLNVGPHAYSWFRERFAGDSFAKGTKTAEVIHLRRHQTAKTQKTCFQTHLGKGDIVIDSFGFGFFNIVSGQGKDVFLIRRRVRAEQKSGKCFRAP
jgi:hypothetical protein